MNFAQAEANGVLSVPVTALLAVSGGNYEVQEAAAPHKLIPVTTGLFAAGDVQISGPGIHPGLQYGVTVEVREWTSPRELAGAATR